MHTHASVLSTELPVSTAGGGAWSFVRPLAAAGGAWSFVRPLAAAGGGA